MRRSNGIVRQCGGFIEVESAPQEGTTIRLYFPRINQEGEETVSEGAAAIAHPAVSETATILVVDDEPGVRELVRIILEEYGYTVLEAGHGEEALQVCQQYAGSIHLLLSDVIMPGLIGAPLVERVKALRPSVKVLFMSGYTDDVIGDRGMLGPGVLFLQKPFTPQALIEKIHDVLRSRAERGKPGRVLAIIVRLFPWLRRISLPATLRRSPTESLPF